MNTLLQCPYCDDEVSFHVDTIPGMQDVSSYTIPSCPNCRKPVVIETRRTTTHTPRRVEGIESPVKTLSPKFREFVDSKYKLPDIPTKDDEGKATHPDPEQYHCQECGCIYPVEFKETRGDRTMCSGCWATEDNQKAGNSQPELEYMNISGNVFAAVSGETVHLKYNDNYLDAWNISIFEVLADMGEVDRRNEIDKLVDGMKYAQQRRTCLNQVVCALLDGDFSLDGDV